MMFRHLFVIIISSIAVLLVTLLLPSSISALEDCAANNNRISIGAGTPPAPAGLDIRLAAGCEVIIGAVQTTAINIRGTGDASTTILIDGTLFSDDTSKSVTTGAYITNTGMSGSLKSFRIINCRASRNIANAQMGTGTTLLFSVSGTIRTDDFEITGNRLQIAGLRAGSSIAGIISIGLGVTASKSFAIHKNNLIMTGSATVTATTPLVFIASCLGTIVSAAPIFNITQNNIIASQINTDGLVPVIASFSSSAMFASGEFLFHSNALLITASVDNNAKRITGSLLSFANTNIARFSRVLFRENAATFTLTMEGDAATIAVACIRFGDSPDLVGISSIAGGFFFERNSLTIRSVGGLTSVITQASLLNIPGIESTNMQIHWNSLTIQAPALATSFTMFNLGNITGATTVLNISSNTVTAKGELDTALTTYEYSMLRIESFKTGIVSFNFQENTFDTTLPDSFLKVDLAFAVFPFYSYKLHRTLCGSNRWDYTYNGANENQALFYYVDNFVMEEQEMTSSWGLLKYNLGADLDSITQQQTYLFPRNANIQKSTTYDNAWIFNRNGYDVNAIGSDKLFYVLGSDSGTVTSLSALATEASSAPAVNTIRMRCPSQPAINYVLKIAYQASATIPTYTRNQDGDLMMYLGTTTFCKLGIAVSREVTTTTTTTVTSTTTTPAPTTTTTSTTTSLTSTTTTPAPPTTSSTTTTTTTTTTPAPPTTSSTTSTTSTTTTTTSTTTSTTSTTTTLPPPTRTITMIPPTPAPTPEPVLQAAATPLAAASIAVAAVPVVAMGVSRSAAVSNLLNSENGCAGPGDGEILGFVDNPFNISIEDAGEDGKYIMGSVIGNIYICFAWLAAQTLIGYGWCWFMDGHLPGFIEVTGRCHVTVFLLLFIGLWMTPTITNAMTYAIRPTSKLGWSAFGLISMLVSQILCCYWAYYTIYIRKEVEQFVVLREDEDSGSDNDDDDFASAETLELEKLGSSSTTAFEAESEKELEERLRKKAKIQAKKVMKQKKKDEKKAKTPVKTTALGNSPKDLLIRFYRYWIRPFGDWYVPDDVDVDDYHAFESAAPAVDAHTKKGRFFTIPDIGLQVGLAFCPVIAELVGDGRESCFAMGLTLTLNLLLYTICLIWYSPMRSRLIEYVLVFVTAIQLVTCVIATITYASSPDWLDNAGIVITVAQTIQAIAGMMDWANRFLVPFFTRCYHKQWHKKRYALRFEDFLTTLQKEEQEEMALGRAEDEEIEKLMAQDREARRLKKVQIEEEDRRRLAAKLKEEQEARDLLLLGEASEPLMEEVRQEASTTFSQPELPPPPPPPQPRGPTDEEILAWRRHELKQLQNSMNDLL